MSSQRPCPVCGADLSQSVLFLPSTIDTDKLTEFSYASRKVPEYMSYELVRCTSCDLVYVHTPPSDEELAQAYHVADYDSSEEAEDAARAYMAAMRPVLSQIKRKEAVLEVGTGTAVLLEHLAAEGFTELVGVEPSTAAIEAAPAHRRQWIREGIFEEGDFEPGSFDLITCFMTMEHVPDPTVIAEAAMRLLRPGGAFVTVTHDYRSRVNRLLGRRSPIIDVEHMQLFSEASIRTLFERVGFEKISVEAFKNRYAFSYWWRLAPVPGALKRAGSRVASALRFDKAKIRFNVGNTIASGLKPDPTTTAAAG